MKALVAVTTIAALFVCGSALAEERSAKDWVVPYGCIKFDAAYDQSRVNTGNFARWVESEASNENDNQFNTTANQSIFGFELRGHDRGSVNVTGRVEMDFYGGGAENEAYPMMRHAYVEMEWPESDFSILAGQTHDLISPLLPGTLNYGLAWWAGDIGYRHPQLRLTKGLPLGGGSRLVIQAAAVRTIGDAVATSPGDTGEDSGLPSFQGRVALSVPVESGKEATCGFSGHVGREEYDYDATNNTEDLETWSANLDLSIPIGNTVTLVGEYWRGRNLDAYLGGIAQGVIVETSTGTFTNAKDASGTFVRSWSIRSTGGWASLRFGPYEKWHFGFGGSFDDPEDADLKDGNRSRNTSVFCNGMYSLTDAVDTGFEVSYWTTEYLNQADGDSYRVQQSFVYEF